jgi:hypothetical protein
MSDHDKQEIADLAQRLLATREQREDWAKFALQMLRERDAMRAERDEAREELATFHATMQTVLDAKEALVVTARADRDRLAACVERVRNLPTWDTLDFEAGTEPVHAVLRDTERNGDYVKSDDILAALEGA